MPNIHESTFSVNKFFEHFDITDSDNFITDFMLNYILSGNGILYQFIEVEVYFHSDDHNDHSVIKRDKNAGDFFFHPYGIDISFQTIKNISGQIASYGGILIRSLKEIDSEHIIFGPFNCLNKLLNSGILLNNMFNIRLEIIPSNKISISEIYKSSRIQGDKQASQEPKLYRYVISNFQHLLSQLPQNSYYRKRTESCELHSIVK